MNRIIEEIEAEIRRLQSARGLLARVRGYALVHNYRVAGLGGDRFRTERAR